VTVGPDHNQRYGTKHRALRARWARKVQAGGVSCAKCGFLIAPGDGWDLGHDPYDRRRYIGPEHQACNRDSRLEKSLRRSPTRGTSRANWF
jgi:hypothetical protein